MEKVYKDILKNWIKFLIYFVRETIVLTN